MPRYVKGDRFRELELDGSTLRTRNGGEGTTISAESESFAGPLQARWEYDRAVALTLAAGYLPVAPAVEPVGPTLAELEQAIAADPDDAEAYLVYADWLQARGDPRGELICVQHAIAEHRRRGRTQQERFFSEEALRLERAELLLMMTHRERFHGPVLGQVHSVDQQTYLVDLFRLEWRLGFVHGAWLPRSPRRDGLTVELWRALLELSSARYLRRATLDWADLDQLTAPPATLRRIDVVLDSWWPSELEEQARRADLEVTPLEQLVGPPEDHADALLKELNPLLEGEATGLRELALQRCRCSRRLLEALLASPLLPRLETLDLSRGNLSDDDLPLLQQRWPALTHLRQLDLERNRFSRQGRGALHALGENVVVKPGGVRG